MSTDKFMKHCSTMQKRLSTTMRLTFRLHEISDDFHVHRHIQSYIIQDLLEYEDILEKEHDDFVELVEKLTLENMKLHIGCVPLDYIDFFEFNGNEVREEYLELIDYLDDYIDLGYKYGIFADMNETINLVMTEKQYNTIKLCEHTTYRALHDIIERYDGVVYSHVNARGINFKIIRFYNNIIDDYFLYRDEPAFDIGFKTLNKLKQHTKLIML